MAIGPGAVMVADATNAFGHLGVAVAFGAAVMIAVAALGTVSGAHINPAVTIALWSVGRFPGRDVPAYLLSQCLGAVAASAALGLTLGSAGNYGATVPTIPVLPALAVEAGFSAILAFVILCMVVDDRVPGAVVPFAIGATVGAGALVTGPLTGGSFNPARSLGPAVAGGIWTAHWLYWLAPITGMLVGVRLAALTTSAKGLAGGTGR